MYAVYGYRRATLEWGERRMGQSDRRDRDRKWITALLFALSLGYTTFAFAQGAPGRGVDVQFLAGTALTIMLALAHGYSRGLDRRLTHNERRQEHVEVELRNTNSALSLLREAMPMNYYTKAELANFDVERSRHTIEHRERVEQGIRDLHNLIERMNTRIDNMGHR